MGAAVPLWSRLNPPGARTPGGKVPCITLTLPALVAQGKLCPAARLHLLQLCPEQPEQLCSLPSPWPGHACGEGLAGPAPACLNTAVIFPVNNQHTPCWQQAGHRLQDPGSAIAFESLAQAVSPQGCPSARTHQGCHTKTPGCHPPGYQGTVALSVPALDVKLWMQHRQICQLWLLSSHKSPSPSHSGARAGAPRRGIAAGSLHRSHSPGPGRSHARSRAAPATHSPYCR